MTKYVQDTKAGKSISAWVILKRHRQIATVRAHYSDGGTVLVNVFNHGKSRSAEKLPFQSGKAGGYGYDKLTAALTGLEIDGHKLTDNCGAQITPKPGELFPRTFTPPRGFHMANFTSWQWGGKDGQEKIELPKDKQGYSSCYREPGLKFLSAIGYNVIKAI